jgi:hypothetical protein
MIRNALVAFTAAAIAVSTFAVSSADARTKRQYYYGYGYGYGQGYGQTYFNAQPSSASLDGRVTGRARTCGHNTFVYDNRGVPTGPYCH